MHTARKPLKSWCQMVRVVGPAPNPVKKTHPPLIKMADNKQTTVEKEDDQTPGGFFDRIRSIPREKRKAYAIAVLFIPYAFLCEIGLAFLLSKPSPGVGPVFGFVLGYIYRRSEGYRIGVLGSA